MKSEAKCGWQKQKATGFRFLHFSLPALVALCSQSFALLLVTIALTFDTQTNFTHRTIDYT